MNFAGFDDEADVTSAQMLGAQQVRLERVRAEYGPNGLFAAAARRP